MSLTLKAARNENVKVLVNAEKMLDTKESFMKDIHDTVKNEEKVVNQWKCIAVEEKGKKKMVMWLVEQKMTKKNFVAHKEAQTEDFEAHVKRVQYEEIRRLKDNLPEINLIVQMDSAENYSCKTLNEIQSAYWNMTNVSLHPFVVYYQPSGATDLKHKSFVIVSDELAYSFNTVLTLIEYILSKTYLTRCVMYSLQDKLSYFPVQEQVHLSGSCKPQGCDAKWNYFESGHGKGPCEGHIGVTKRMADDTNNTGKATIQNPQDFYAWTQSEICNLQNIKFLSVAKEECEAKAVQLNQKRDIKAISGTMRIHAIIGRGNSEVSVRDTSWYCTVSMSEELTCGSWRRTFIEKVKTKVTSETETIESVL